MNRLTDLLNFGLRLTKTFRPSLTVYIVVLRNSMKIVNLHNQQIAFENASQEFSSDRLLIAEPIVAESLGIKLLNQVCSTTDLKTKSLKVVCHRIDKEFHPLSTAERMILNDFVNQIGGNEIVLLDETVELSAEELKNYA